MIKITKKELAKDASLYLARKMAEAIRKKPDIVMCFATGRTMDAVYHELVQLNKNEPLDCSQVRCFIVDEYIGLKKDSENSYRHYMNEHLFNLLNFNEKNIITPDPHSKNHDEASRAYEENIREASGIDFLILGVGLNGHIGFNEPGSSFDSRTRVVAIAEETKSSNKTLFYNGEEFPKTAISIGIGTILESKKCYLLATGETKSHIIKRFIEEAPHGGLPVSALKNHLDFELILDKDAAKLLE